MTEKNKYILAETLLKVTLKRKALEAEEKELRFDLDKLMKEEEYFKFPVKDGRWRVMNEKNDVRVLHDNRFIAKAIGKEKFLDIAGVSIGDLTKVVGKEEIGKFVHRIITSYRIVVRKENGDD